MLRQRSRESLRKILFQPIGKKGVLRTILSSLVVFSSISWIVNQEAVQSRIFAGFENINISSEHDENYLKTIIAKKYPMIENPGITDWRKVNILRRWAYENIKISTKESCLLETVFYPDFYQKSATEMYLSFKSNVGGVWCGGSSIFLAKLYRYYGFEAFTLNTGQLDLWTHVVTLVRIRHQGRRPLIIQDALVNVTYTHQDGLPLDYFDLIRLLQQRKSKQIKIIQYRNTQRYLLVCPNATPEEFALRRKLFPCEPLPNGGMTCRYKPILEHFTNRTPRAAEIKSRLQKAGYEPDFIYMFMYSFSIHDGVKERTDLLNKTKAIIASKKFSRGEAFGKKS